MTFFTYLDNKFRNLGLDNQISFSLKKDGAQKAAHSWVIGIRRFWITIYFLSFPINYILIKCRLLKPDVEYNSRYEEIKTNSDRVRAELEAAKKAQQVPNMVGNQPPSVNS